MFSQKYIKDIRDFFFGRIDAYGLWSNDTWITVKERLTDAILLKHLNKEITIGIYPYYKKNNLWYCKWICLDIDDHKEVDIQKLKEKFDLLTYGMTIVIKEKYKIEKNNMGREMSGRGYHIWIKLKDFTPLELAYKFKKHIERLLSDIYKMEFEINPKQNKIKENELGNFVKLPFGINRKCNIECRMLDTFDISMQGNGYEIVEEYIIQKEEKKKEIKIQKEIEVKKEKIIKDLPIGKLKKQHQDILNGIIEIEEYAEKVGKELGKNRGEIEFLYWIELFREAYDKYRYKPQDLFPILEKNQSKFDITETEKQLKYHNYTEKKDSKHLLSLMKKYYPNYYIKKEKEKIEGNLERYIAQRILRNNNICTLIETDEICISENGCYYRGKKGLSNIRTQIMDIYESDFKEIKAGSYSRNIILEMIRTSTFEHLKDFDKYENLINVKNGVIKLDYKKDSIEFIKHKDLKEPVKSFIQIPIIYDPNAECPIIESFLIDVFNKDRLDLMYEIIGDFISPTVKFQKAFIIYGDPDSAKTTFMEMIFKFLGGNHIAQIKLQFLSHRFKLANLRGKLLNWWDDLDPYKINKSDIFRILTTNKYLSGEIKNIQDDIQWVNTTKQLYSCNDLPEVSPKTGDEFWRRWIIISCNSLFKDKDKMKEEDYDDPNVFLRDINISEKIATPKEFSGLLNKCLKGMLRLEKRKCFPIEWDDIEKVKGLWLIDINPVKLFVDEYCDVGVDYKIDYDIFIKELNKFRTENHKVRAISKTMSTKSLKKISENIKKMPVNKKAHPESSGYNYVGIKFKDDYIIEYLNLEKFEQKKIDGVFIDKITEAGKVNKNQIKKRFEKMIEDNINDSNEEYINFHIPDVGDIFELDGFNRNNVIEYLGEYGKKNNCLKGIKLKIPNPNFSKNS